MSTKFQLNIMYLIEDRILRGVIFIFELVVSIFRKQLCIFYLYSTLFMWKYDCLAQYRFLRLRHRHGIRYNMDIMLCIVSLQCHLSKFYISYSCQHLLSKNNTHKQRLFQYYSYVCKILITEGYLSIVECSNIMYDCINYIEFFNKN
jgi:hypothetical protein